MSDLSEQLRNIAKLNFCKDCYNKYLVLIGGEIEYLLSEPLADWRQTEHNIDIIWIKAKGLCDTEPVAFSPHTTAIQKAKDEKLWKKLKFLRDKGTIKNFTYQFLDIVSKRRNKVHSLSKFSKEDYILFKEAKAFTDFIQLVTIFELGSPWKEQLNGIENRAKRLLEKMDKTELL